MKRSLPFPAPDVSSNQIMLTWDGSMTNHGINYVIEKRVGQSGANVQVINVMDDTSFLDTGLAENTTYYPYPCGEFLE